MDEPKQTVIGVLWRQRFWVFPLLVAAGIGLGMFKISAYQQAAAFSDKGVKVVGEITNLHEYQNKQRTTYRVSYTFVTAADPYTQGKQRVREPLFDTLTEGGPVDVWYLPNDPKRNVIDLDALTHLFWLTLFCASGLIFAGLWGGWLAVKSARATVEENQNSET
ncbi:DUF3592 domain-containing protein [uncultured Aliiroseovarius sp.]|uniref:DUF3592 domain-containing protein n=1 Tax=uncultured Aliiroseovarius sp. TaxID=1658783 RepID=UPI0025984581|nr:DUF3592 domain-containing protein [uncultured Aliiroseovarius sp.]